MRVVYDSEDENVHKLLKGIFGPDQMLDVKNGKIAKIHSSLTPKQRDYFLGMVSEAVGKMESQDEKDEIIEENNIEIKDHEQYNYKGEVTEIKKHFDEDNYIEENNLGVDSENFNLSNFKDKEIKLEENKNSRKVSAEKLIQEFSNFLKNIS